MNADYQELELADWLATQPMIVLVNARTTPEPTKSDIPAHILDRLDGRRPGLLVLDPDQLWAHGIILSHDQLTQFRAGEPILLAVGADKLPGALKRGRREREKIEKEVQDALAVQVYLGTERICALLERQRGSRWRKVVSAQREEVLEQLSSEAWIEDGKGLEGVGERSRSSFRTQYDAGSRLACSLYRWASSPGELAKGARRAAVAECDRLGGRELAAGLVEQDVKRIRFLVSCLRQATSLVRAINEMAGDVRAERPATKGTVRTLAGAVPDRPFLSSAVRAAIDCDINTTAIFRSLLSYRDLVEVARALGRYHRGEDIRLDPGQVAILERQLLVGLSYVEGKSELESDEHGAAVLIARAMLEMGPVENWRSALTGAIAQHSAITLTH